MDEMRREAGVDGPAMIGADANGAVIIWNRAAADLVGMDATDATGRNVEMLVPAEFVDQHRAGFAAAMAGGPRTADEAPFHLPVRTVDGSIVVCAVRFVFLDDPYGRPAGAMLVLRRAAPGAEPFTPVPADGGA